MIRLSIVTDVFTFSKQRAIQLLFALENLSCFLLTARKSAPETRFKCEPLSYKRRDAQIKSAVLVSGVPYQKSTLKNLEHILPCK